MSLQTPWIHTQKSLNYKVKSTLVNEKEDQSASSTLSEQEMGESPKVSHSFFFEYLLRASSKNHATENGNSHTGSSELVHTGFWAQENQQAADRMESQWAVSLAIGYTSIILPNMLFLVHSDIITVNRRLQSGSGVKPEGLLLGHLSLHLGFKRLKNGKGWQMITQMNDWMCLN